MMAPAATKAPIQLPELTITLSDGSIWPVKDDPAPQITVTDSEGRTVEVEDLATITQSMRYHPHRPVQRDEAAADDFSSQEVVRDTQEPHPERPSSPTTARRIRHKPRGKPTRIWGWLPTANKNSSTSKSYDCQLKLEPEIADPAKSLPAIQLTTPHGTVFFNVQDDCKDSAEFFEKPSTARRIRCKPRGKPSFYRA